jgi:hypothetical protein
MVNKRSVIPVSGNNTSDNYQQFYNKPKPNPEYIKIQQNLFLCLKNIIRIVIEKCNKPIKKETINYYMQQNYFTISVFIQKQKINITFMDEFNQETFNYDLILSKLISLYNSNLENKKAEILKYIELWDLVIEKYNSNANKKIKLKNLIKELQIKYEF